MTRPIQLGLCDEPKRRFLFVSQDESGTGACWYEFDFTTKKKTPIPQRGVRGYISGIRIAKSKTSHGEKQKLDVFIDAGEESYAIRSGVDTTFARGLIQSLMAIENPEELKGVLTIVASPSEQNTKIVFCGIWITETGRRVKFNWDKDADLYDPITFLQSVLGNGGSEVEEHEEQSAGEPPPFDQPSSPPISSEEERRHQLQVRELKRVGALAGLAFEPGTENELLVELNQHCGGLYKNADGTPKVIEQLTRDEAIAYRKTLLSL